jgi:hypothetical protein
MAGAAHLSISLASFEAVEGDTMLVGAEPRIGSPSSAGTRFEPRAAVLTRAKLSASGDCLPELQPKRIEKCIWPEAPSGALGRGVPNDPGAHRAVAPEVNRTLRRRRMSLGGSGAQFAHRTSVVHYELDTPASRVTLLAKIRNSSPFSARHGTSLPLGPLRTTRRSGLESVNR